MPGNFFEAEQVRHSRSIAEASRLPGREFRKTELTPLMSGQIG
jgi:hypothetical protein